MKTVYRSIALSLTALALFATTPPARAAAEAREFNCEPKLLAIYSPGPHWGDLEQKLDAHLEFIDAELKSGVIEHAGPMVSEQGDPEGGMIIYHLTDRSRAKALTESDPLVKDGVARFELRAWLNCR
jgi:uncharacterized protein YciI